MGVAARNIEDDRVGGFGCDLAKLYYCSVNPLNFVKYPENKFKKLF